MLTSDKTFEIETCFEHFNKGQKSSMDHYSYLPTPQSLHVNSSNTYSWSRHLVQTQQHVSPSLIFCKSPQFNANFLFLNFYTLTAPISHGSEHLDFGYNISCPFMICLWRSFDSSTPQLTSEKYKVRSGLRHKSIDL